MDNNKNDNSLEEIKNIIRTKEEEISKSQIKVNNLENTNKKLEKQKRSIKKGCRAKASAILFYIAYNIAMMLLLVGYITPFIETFKVVTAIQKTLSIAALYIGILTISVLGALAAAKVETLLRRKSKNKCLEIENKIENQKQQISKEIEFQQSLKKDITKTLDELDISRNEILSPKEEINYINEHNDYLDEEYLDETNEMPYIKRKKRY